MHYEMFSQKRSYISATLHRFGCSLIEMFLYDPVHVLLHCKISPKVPEPQLSDKGPNLTALLLRISCLPFFLSVIPETLIPMSLNIYPVNLLFFRNQISSTVLGNSKAALPSCRISNYSSSH